MNEHGLDPSLEPSGEPRKSKAAARTVVGGIAALGTVSVFLFLSLIGTIWLERRGFAALAVLVVAPLYIGAYRVFSKWGRAWKLIAFLATYIPPLANLLSEKERRQAIGNLVERIECVVGFYGLKGFFPAGQIIESRRGFPRFSGPLAKALIDTIPNTLGPDNWPAALIAGLAQKLDWEPEKRKVLDLLYQERLGQCDSTVWQRFRRDDEADQALRLLAGALAGSGKLPGRAASWSAEDVATVLGEMSQFSWDLLRDRLHELADLSEKAADYLGFLKENRVALEDKPPSVDGLKKVLALPPGRFIPPEVWRDATLLVQVGRTAIREASAEKAKLAQVASSGSDELRRYALLAAILYLTRVSPKDPARGRLCLDLAAEPQDEGVRLAWAYLQLKHDFRNSEQRPADRQFLRFDDLVESWRSQLDRTAATPYLGNELAELRSILEEGNWVNRLSDLLEQARSERLKQQLPPSDATAKKEDVARKVVKRYKLDHRSELLGNLVRQVDLEILARNLEAGQFIPYLITFQADRGPLSRLIDCLTMPKKLVQAGVETAVQYDFRPYTENARIGLVPEGWSFERFRKAFQEDFTKVLDASAKLLRQGAVGLQGIEIMLHRFSALGGCAFTSPLCRRVALTNLTDLLVEKLPPEKLVSLVQSSTTVSLKDYVLSASIPDVVGDEERLTGAEATLLESQDGQIKSELLGKLHTATIPQLAQCLWRKKIEHNTATEVLADLLERYVPQFDEPRSSRVADVYLSGLESLAAA